VPAEVALAVASRVYKHALTRIAPGLLCLFVAAFLVPSDHTYRPVQWELLWQVDEPELLHPTQMAVGPDGRVYVMDYGDMRPRVFTPDGQLQRIVGRGEGQARVNSATRSTLPSMPPGAFPRAAIMGRADLFGGRFGIGKEPVGGLGIGPIGTGLIDRPGRPGCQLSACSEQSPLQTLVAQRNVVQLINQPGGQFSELRVFRIHLGFLFDCFDGAKC